MPTPAETIAEITDSLKAVERAHRRTGKLIGQLHEDLAQAVADHGPGMGVTPAGIAPKAP
ncbi:MAG: hypothetical protein ACKO1K_03745 [Burkholderiales bacterium]